MQGFTMIDLVILVVYLAAVLFAGLHFAKREMKGKEDRGEGEGKREKERKKKKAMTASADFCCSPDGFCA